METRRLLLVMTLIFSVVLLVQYIELPYGYVLSSLLSFGKSQSGSSLASEASNITRNWGSKLDPGSVNSTKMNVASEFLNTTRLTGGKSDLNKQDLESEMNKHSNDDYRAKDILGLNHNLNDEEVISNKTSLSDKAGQHENELSSYSRNSSLDNLRATSTVPTLAKHENISQLTSPQAAIPPTTMSSPVSAPDTMRIGSSNNTRPPSLSTNIVANEPPTMVLNNYKPAQIKSDLTSSFSNSSPTKTSAKKKNIKRPPAVVVPISEMNEMLARSRLTYKSIKPHWPSPVDKELLGAKSRIESASIMEKNLQIDVDVYRNYSTFVRSYELMEKTLKIYIYTEGDPPIFHGQELEGVYASEGWFMKLLEKNKHFVTTNASEAHLFYLPFSSRLLKKVLYVENSHNRKNMVQYLSNYLHNISTTYPYWNRASGADHFLVACHDWAPAVTSQIMSNCIRALCNADVMVGFQFGKDVSLPEINVRNALNPLQGLGGKPPSQRRILAFFAGNMHGYLRPLLLNYWKDRDRDMKIFGKLHSSKGQMTYIQYMKNSKYCISAKGYESYTPRVMEAIFYQCVPVIISDNYVPPFFETLRWESFAVFVLEKDIPNLKKILKSIPKKRYLKMQDRVKQVQKHFLWHNTPVKYDVFHMILHSIWYNRVSQM